MFDDFFVFACFIGIAFFIYKWFELLILKKERMEALSRLEGDNLLEYTKRMPIGLGGGASVAQQKPSHPAAWPLRWGLLLLGIGLGFFFGWVAVINQELNFNDKELVCGALVLVGGGLGLIIAFIVEHILYQKDE